MRTLFWIAIFADIAVLGLFFLLGLAAAPSAKTSAFAVTAAMLPVPVLLIIGAILMFTRMSGDGWRGLAVILAASPWLLIFVMRANEEVKIRMTSDASGKMTYFRSGTLREIADAISRNDAAKVAELAPQVNVNAHGYSGMTLLMFAFRQMRETPGEIGCMRALLKAGANPNEGADYSSPLETAIQLSGKTGPEPVMLLLAAGADPNRKNTFGAPVYYQATGLPVPPGVLQAMLDHGANVKTLDGNRLSVAFDAASAGNWKAVLLLVQRGAPWKGMFGANGLSLVDSAESYRRVYGDREGLEEAIAYLRAH